MRLIFILLLINHTGLVAQNRAILIKHAGYCNSLIFPVVLTDDSLTEEFIYKYLNFDGHILNSVKPTRIDSVKYNSVKSILTKELSSNLDTSAVNLQCGSFNFITVNNNISIDTITILDYKIAIRIIRNYMTKIERLQFEELTTYYDDLYLILKEFEPNSTKIYLNDLK